MRHTGSREEEEEDAQMCPCGKAVESRTHIPEKCEIYKEENRRMSVAWRNLVH